MEVRAILEEIKSSHSVKVALSKLNQLSCLYKDKGYMGPAQVLSANSRRGMITVTVLAKPWQESSKSFKFQLSIPVDGVSYDDFSIRLDAGYGINGMFVHNHQAIEEITRMWERGASTQELLHAFNFQTGLSVKVNGTKN